VGQSTHGDALEMLSRDVVCTAIVNSTLSPVTAMIPGNAERAPRRLDCVISLPPSLC
jgi:hypothetical protein